MAVEIETDRDYRDAFVERVRIARIAAGYTQDEIGKLLGVKTNTYNRYEGGRGEKKPTVMPMRLVTLFCIACRISERWLLSGQGQGPQVARPMRRSEVA